MVLTFDPQSHKEASKSVRSTASVASSAASAAASAAASVATNDGLYHQPDVETLRSVHIFCILEGACYCCGNYQYYVPCTVCVSLCVLCNMDVISCPAAV